MKADIGTEEKNFQAVADSLNILLANEHILYIKTRNYHWNVEGSNFMEMHKFYEEQYETLAKNIDEVAERIRFVGRYAAGKLKGFLKITNLEEQDHTTEQKVQIRNL